MLISNSICNLGGGFGRILQHGWLWRVCVAGLCDIRRDYRLARHFDQAARAGSAKTARKSNEINGSRLGLVAGAGLEPATSGL